LKKENGKLRMERDILKKAAAYFAKESMPILRTLTILPESSYVRPHKWKGSCD
jgi:transposase